MNATRILLSQIVVLLALPAAWPGFLEAGGMINFVIEGKKIRFEINLAVAAREKLLIRSSLLRLAVRTIAHDSWERPDDEDRKGKRGNR